MTRVTPNTETFYAVLTKNVTTKEKSPRQKKEKARGKRKMLSGGNKKVIAKVKSLCKREKLPAKKKMQVAAKENIL